MKPIHLKLSDEEFAALEAYRTSHQHNGKPIKRHVAMRIALARLIAKKPTKAELEAHTIPLGNVENLKNQPE